MSKRHDIVSKILTTSFAFAALFGASSVFYAFAEAKLGNSLDNDSALSALKVSLAIDEISLRQEMKDSQTKCERQEIESCETYIKSLVKTKNRIKDYKLLAVKTLGFSTQSEEIKALEEQRTKIDKLTRTQFGLSLREAKKKDIISIEQFLDYLKQENKFKEGPVDERLSEIFDQTIKLINEDIIGREKISQETYASYQNLKRAFFILLFVEITVFVLVNSADLLNTNADPEDSEQINLRKIQAITKPLLASVFLAFICLLIGQLLLYRESERSLIGHCREINRQNISLMTSLDTYPGIKNKSKIIPLMKPSENCLNYIEPFIGSDIRELNQYSTTTEQLKLEIQKMKLRKYADGYQDKESEFDEKTSNLLLSILITNVSSLVALAIFLKKDSEEIG